MVFIPNLSSPNQVLEEAVVAKDVSRVQLALENRADPNGSYMGAPFVWLAASQGQIEIVKALVAYKVNLNVVHHFESPAAVALHNNHSAVGVYILQNGGKMIDRNNCNRLRREHPALPLNQLSSSPLVPHQHRSNSHGHYSADEDITKYFTQNIFSK